MTRMDILRSGENADLIGRLDAIGKPSAIYAEVLERGALEQFVEAMQQDCVVQGALMPDAHFGYTLPIGGVVATVGKVFPAFVGYDIGCGMCAVPLTCDPDALRAAAKEVFDNVYRDVPVGRNHNKEPVAWDAGLRLERTAVIQEQIDNGCFRQLGSLGDGNHFIEIGEDESRQPWVVVHCGSRNVGHRTATHYMKLACGEDKAREGHFGLDVDSDGGRAYLTDLAFALEFALENRKEIVRRVAAIVARRVGGEADWSRLINRNHNHAEERGGVWIHRKGATHAEAGMLGVIPGNMKDGSFIVEGLGNPDSLFSSSHGAGRIWGRNKATKEIALEDFQRAMDGIVARVKDDTIDESPFAYKPIEAVMAAQSDLVRVLHRVRPILNVKGFKEGDRKRKKPREQAPAEAIGQAG